MISKLAGAIVGAAVLSLVGAASPANASINFDDIPNAGTGTLIANGYHGLDWTNFYATNSSDDGLSGYANNEASAPNVAYNGYGGVSEVLSATNFTLNSFDLGAAWNNGLTVVVEGLEDGHIIDATDFVVSATGPAQLKTLDWSGIDELTFFTFGGNNAGYNGQGTQFVLDNLDIAGPGVTGGTPEPSIWALAFVGVGLAGWRLRSQRRSATRAAAVIA